MALNKSFGSFEDYAEARLGKARPPAPGDPLAKFWVIGWWWTGEIIEFPNGALPSTVFVDSIQDAKFAAQKGWVPVQFVREEVLELFVAFFAASGEPLPKPLAEALKERLAPKPAPAKK